MLFLLMLGLFLIAAGLGLMIFGEPTIVEWNIDIPPDSEPATTQYDTHILGGWALIIIGLVPLLLSFIIFLDRDTEEKVIQHSA
ncbi:MAG: hypothetical protein KJI70_00525 [Patescibacteria group bacterium]|nr:hypothetical protein [Patescibacteria group bacterium]